MRVLWSRWDFMAAVWGWTRGLLYVNRRRRGGDEMGCAEAMRELKGMLCVEMKEEAAVCGAETDVKKKRRWCCCREGEENRWGWRWWLWRWWGSWFYRMGIRVLGLSSPPTLGFFLSKTSSLSSTLVTLAQVNNYENNIFHKLLFLDRLDSLACKTHTSTSDLLFFI